MMDVMNEMKMVRKEMDQLRKKIVIKGVQEVVSEEVEIESVEEEKVEKVGAIVDTKADGDCAFHLVARRSRREWTWGG